MQLLEQLTEIKIDPSKKNVLVFDKVPDGEFTHIDGTGKLMKERLKKDFNVFTVWQSKKNASSEPNQFLSNAQNAEYSDQFLRKEQDSNHLEKNVKTLYDCMKSTEILPEFEFCLIVSNTVLTMPLTPYCSKGFDKDLCERKSEYFDYTGTNEEFLNKIAIINENLFGSGKKEFFRRFSPYALSTKLFSNTYLLFEHLYETGKVKKFVSFLTDPNMARNFFECKGIPLDTWYYADDFRGTRSMKGAAVAQMQQHYAERTTHSDSWGDVQKTKNCIFAGTVFHEKGPRREIWETFLRDYADSSSDYYVPIKKNGIISREKETPGQIEYVQERFPELYKEVQNHPSSRPFLTPKLLELAIENYKYGLVFRCVSVYDSLNTKPYQYASKDVLPLLDWKYDPENLLRIPEDVLESITIKDSKDIDNMVRFYNDHPDERTEILCRLKDHFGFYEFSTNPVEAIEREYQNMLKEARKDG